MDAKLLEMSISLFEYYSDIMQRLIDRMLKSVELNNTERKNLSLATECKKQLVNITTFLKIVKILSLSVDTQTVNQLAGVTENWVDSFKTRIMRSQKFYKK